MEEYSPLRPAGGKGQPAGAIPVLAKAGDVLLFDRRLRRARARAVRPFRLTPLLFAPKIPVNDSKCQRVMTELRACSHAATPNWSQTTRKGYFVGYSYRWYLLTY